jgi:RNA polymerase sigma factor (sigma-70 family)
MTEATMTMDETGSASDPLVRYRRERDPSAFAELVHQHGGMVHATCQRLLGRNHPMVDDACQAVFMLLLRRVDRIHDPSRLAGWLHGASIAVAANMRRAERRRKKREQAVSALSAEQPESSGLAIRTMIDAGLEKLSAAQREAVLRHYLEGKPHGEIAAELGCSEGAVKKRVADGLARLRVYFKQRGRDLSLASLGSALVTERVEAMTPAAAHACDAAMIATSPPVATAVAASVQAAARLMTLIIAAMGALVLATICVVVAYSQPPVVRVGDERQADPAAEIAKAWVIDHAGTSAAFTPNGLHFVYGVDLDESETTFTALNIADGTTKAVIALPTQKSPASVDDVRQSAAPLAVSDNLAHIFFTQNRGGWISGLWAWHRDKRLPVNGASIDQAVNIEYLCGNSRGNHHVERVRGYGNNGAFSAFTDMSDQKIIIVSMADGVGPTITHTAATSSDRISEAGFWRDMDMFWTTQAPELVLAHVADTPDLHVSEVEGCSVPIPATVLASETQGEHSLIIRVGGRIVAIGRKLIDGPLGLMKSERELQLSDGVHSVVYDQVNRHVIECGVVQASNGYQVSDVTIGRRGLFGAPADLPVVTVDVTGVYARLRAVFPPDKRCGEYIDFFAAYDGMLLARASCAHADIGYAALMLTIDLRTSHVEPLFPEPIFQNLTGRYESYSSVLHASDDSAVAMRLFGRWYVMSLR